MPINLHKTGTVTEVAILFPCPKEFSGTVFTHRLPVRLAPLHNSLRVKCHPGLWHGGILGNNMNMATSD